MNRLRKTILSGFAWMVALVIFATPIVSAQLKDPLSFPYYDPNSESCQTNSGAHSNRASGSGPVYIVGDSITVGAQTSGDLATQLANNGLTIEHVNAIVGRSVTSGGQGTQSGLEAIADDRARITNANSVVVALGTNGGSEADITNMINAIKGIKTTAQIYWVNVFSPGAVGNPATFNETLNRLSEETQLFEVIDTTTANIVTTDQLHPDEAGQEIFARTIATAISGNSTTAVSASGCSCSVSGNGGDRDARYRAAWAYLTNNKGLSAEAAAGLMGNLEAESGIDPHNTQNNASAPDGPEIPIDAIRGSHGYGIAQWTSSGRQDNLIAYARETNRSTGDLGLQLDFLWKELEESYTGVLSVLQTPGVTMEESSDEVLLRFEIPASVLGGDAERRATMSARQALGRAIFNEFSGQNIASTLGGGGCSNSGSAIDLVSQDTTHINCGGTTEDAGDADGYNRGALHRIKLCRVGGTLVNSQISGAMEQMLAAASAAGIDISIGGFRAMEGCANCQVEMYRSRCIAQGLDPTDAPYPKATYDEYQKCDSIAPPGYSNHQMGLAVDVSCDGEIITRYQPAAGSNPCFRWLVENGARFNLYEFGKGEGNRNSGDYEAWHWSVDGN